MKSYRSKYANFDGRTLILLTKYADRVTLPVKLYEQLQDQVPEKIFITDARGTPRGQMDPTTLKTALTSATIYQSSNPKFPSFYVMTYQQSKEYGTKPGKSGPIKIFSKEEIQLMNSK